MLNLSALLQHKDRQNTKVRSILSGFFPNSRDGRRRIRFQWCLVNLLIKKFWCMTSAFGLYLFMQIDLIDLSRGWISWFIFETEKYLFHQRMGMIT